ncbi:MAG TPA: SagB/ThcOx family dehydrogenase [Dehalococcoidia bacterium]|nr:SagB/ThcOx family dehydrogenase [Dehalococcoidia bacterium]
MGNRDTAAAWEYHNSTKHSYWSVRLESHQLDWANEPLPFKLYRGLEPIPLPRDLDATSAPCLEAIGCPDYPTEREVPDLATLASLLYFSAGITKRVRYPGGEIYFRAAACTGALYHIDLYLVCADLPDLPAGVYHFGPHDFALRRLRQGDYRPVLVEASGGEPALSQAPAAIVFASTFWRNAWKYRARTYRHAFWDSGTILANLLAMAAAHRLPARVVLGFADAPVDHLLGLDGRREASLFMVALGRSSPAAGKPPPVPRLELETVRPSPREVEYPAIVAIHQASSLESGQEAAAWRGPPPPLPWPPPSGPLFPLQPLDDPPSDGVEEVVLRRGSTRRFDRSRTLDFRELSTIVRAATRGVPADFLPPSGLGLNRLFIIAGAVDGLPAGAYLYRPQEEALELLREGDFRAQAGYLALEQPLGADACADLYLLSPLGMALERFGNRGYRAAQLEAGTVGGKVYLAAYALRRGATGLTFYDDDVVSFFSPAAGGHCVMFLTAVGVPRRRR